MTPINDIYVSYSSLLVNMIIAYFMFDNTKKRRIISIILTILLIPFTLLWYYKIRHLLPMLRIIPGGLFFAVPFFYLVQGTLLQKIFLMTSEIFLCQLVSVFINMICRTLFNPTMESLVIPICYTLFLLIYVSLGIKYGSVFIRKLFYVKGTLNWILYNLLTTVSIFVLHALYVELLRTNFGQFTPYHWLPPLYMGVCFLFLCYSIITTQNKLVVEYKHNLSTSIINSGKNYYDKITSLYEEVRILRHDYKYHLAALKGMLSSPQNADDYLSQLTEEIFLENPTMFCGNMAINAVLHDYARRCKELDIELHIQIVIPQQYGMEDYELCIIIGNLMENAILAASSLEKGRYIHLDMKQHNSQLAIRVQNSFDGLLKYDVFGEELISKKEKGGIGIQSIRTIVSRYQGYYTHSKDKNDFTAYVVMNISESPQ